MYSSVLKFNDLADFLDIFPEVQRDIIPRKVSSVRRYILSGLDNGDDKVHMRFFSAVTVTCRSTIYYDEKNHRCAIDTFNSKLSVNDGQHRFEGIRTAIEYLEREFLKSKNKERTGKIKAQIDELKEMVIPIVIFDDLSEVEESQMFHDLNNLAQRPSKNANIRLNQTDLYSKMAIQLAKENRYLSHIGVETDKMSIMEQNPNTILLSTIHASIKEILSVEYKLNNKFLTENNLNKYKKLVSETFDQLFQALPHDINSKGVYILDKAFAIKSITKFIAQSRIADVPKEDIFKAIQDVDWTNNIDFWSKYGGMKGRKGPRSIHSNHIVFGGGTSAGHRAVLSALNDQLNK